MRTWHWADWAAKDEADRVLVAPDGEIAVVATMVLPTKAQFIIDALNAAEQPTCQVDDCKEDPRQCGSRSCILRAAQQFVEEAIAGVRRSDEPSEAGKAVLRDLQSPID